MSTSHRQFNLEDEAEYCICIRPNTAAAPELHLKNPKKSDFLWQMQPSEHPRASSTHGLTSMWKLDCSSGAATSVVAKQSTGAPEAFATKRAPTPSSHPSGPTTESVPDGTSSTTVHATSAADGRARAVDSGVVATRTPRLAAETTRRDSGSVLEKSVRS
jgi:hypothetical protein